MKSRANYTTAWIYFFLETSFKLIINTDLLQRCFMRDAPGYYLCVQKSAGVHLCPAPHPPPPPPPVASRGLVRNTKMQISLLFTQRWVNLARRSLHVFLDSVIFGQGLSGSRTAQLAPIWAKSLSNNDPSAISQSQGPCSKAAEGSEQMHWHLRWTI